MLILFLFQNLLWKKLFTNVSDEGTLFGWQGGSGGYLEYTFRRAAKELFGRDILDFDYKTVRRNNNDFREVKLEIEGQTVLSFAIAYGFRNIQNLVQKIKQGKSIPYHFIEVMACPSGCLNGGGQIRPQNDENPKQLLKRVESIYTQQLIMEPHINQSVQHIYHHFICDVPSSPKAISLFHTHYHPREKLVSNLVTQW